MVQWDQQLIIKLLGRKPGLILEHFNSGNSWFLLKGSSSFNKLGPV